MDSKKAGELAQDCLECGQPIDSDDAFLCTPCKAEHRRNNSCPTCGAHQFGGGDCSRCSRQPDRTFSIQEADVRQAAERVFPDFRDLVERVDVAEDIWAQILNLGPVGVAEALYHAFVRGDLPPVPVPCQVELQVRLPSRRSDP